MPFIVTDIQNNRYWIEIESNCEICLNTQPY